jgi:hypothetical protein
MRKWDLVSSYKCEGKPFKLCACIVGCFLFKILMLTMGDIVWIHGMMMAKSNVVQLIIKCNDWCKKFKCLLSYGSYLVLKLIYFSLKNYMKKWKNWHYKPTQEGHMSNAVLETT